MADIVDSYSEANANTTTGVFGTTRVAQVFQAGLSRALNSAKFYLLKTGSPTGSAFAHIYATTGSLGTTAIPTGSPLATSDAFDVSTLTGSLALITFTFTGANLISITSGTNYAVAFKYSGGDASNLVRIGIDSTSPTHAGNLASFNGSSWTAFSSLDTAFYVYGDAANIVANQASFALTGQNTSLLAQRELTAAHASFTLTGQDSLFAKTRNLFASVASFVLTGIDAALTPPIWTRVTKNTTDYTNTAKSDTTWTNVPKT